MTGRLRVEGSCNNNDDGGHADETTSNAATLQTSATTLRRRYADEHERLSLYTSLSVRC